MEEDFEFVDYKDLEDEPKDPSSIQLSLAGDSQSVIKNRDETTINGFGAMIRNLLSTFSRQKPAEDSVESSHLNKFQELVTDLRHRIDKIELSSPKDQQKELIMNALADTLRIWIPTIHEHREHSIGWGYCLKELEALSSCYPFLSRDPVSGQAIVQVILSLPSTNSTITAIICLECGMLMGNLREKVIETIASKNINSETVGILHDSRWVLQTTQLKNFGTISDHQPIEPLVIDGIITFDLKSTE